MIASFSNSPSSHSQEPINIVFEDAGEQQLKNIARSVRVYRVKLGEGDATQLTAPALALPDKLSIAVLPFQNMSGDSDQDYFCDGMVEDVITGLSRIKWLFVIARNSTFTHEPAVAGDIAGEDGGQSPFNALFSHIDCPAPGGRMEFMAGC